MTSFKISGCTVSDGAAIAENSIPAFWQNPNWRLAWPHRTLTYHISQVAKRIPRNLLNDRDTKRHQKAIDGISGRILGYARWSLPSSHTRDIEGKPVWEEAVVPVVGEDQEREIKKVAADVVWDPNQESDVLLGELRSIETEIEERGVWMRLEYLAVHPDFQGKGIGTALVESGMREAEKLGLGIFIVAMPSGMGVYEHLGFKIERVLVQDDSMFGGTGDHRTYFMVFEQKTGGVEGGEDGV
ncbi:acetyltransferase [Cadophora sp. MPI-SDFR-AT-0126]|nr:acetyltransferase [Leotiomycetes sp. MPI-SDFR-AT-0126]